jgi:hypothetical protein
MSYSLRAAPFTPYVQRPIRAVQVQAYVCVTREIKPSPQKYVNF